MSSGSTIGGVLRRWARDQPDVEYVVCDDDRLTYAAAERRSRQLARGLLAAGVGRGTRVALLFPTGVDFVLLWLAISRVGAITVPISTFSTPYELRDLVGRAAVDTLIGVPSYRGNEFAAAVEDVIGFASDAPRPVAAPYLRQVWLDDAVAALDARAADVSDALFDAVDHDVTADDRLVMVHTSGSTSAPKGVIHQHGQLIGHMANLNRLRGLDSGTKLFSNSPMFWIGGLGYNLVGVLEAGATLLCSAAADPADTLDFIERERPELTNGFVASVAALVAHPSFASRDFSSIRSGNLHPLSPPGLRPADPELRHNMLGMTETGSVCLMDPDESDQPEHRRGSFGRPVPDLDARVVDFETLEDVAPGQLGELWFRGPSVMAGYDGRERHEVFTPDQWFRTGDVFTVDDDGFFYFHGRRGDMIKTAGANVSPKEVEAALREVTGGLASMVIGLPDEERGQIVAAIVMAEPADAPDVDELRMALRARLSAYKVPRRYAVIEPAALPMLSTGKPDLRRIVESFDAWTTS